MYNASARFYDLIYSKIKDYEREAADLLEVIRSRGDYEGKSLLDVACGTGEHLRYLKDHFRVEGLDLSPELLRIAGAKNPGVPVHLGNMLDFELGRSFEVITCLFSSIGYMTSVDELNAAVATMGRHLNRGGLLLVEPWFTPETWKEGHISLAVAEGEGLKVARMSTSRTEGKVSAFDFHFLVGTPEGTSHLVETHRMGLFTQEEMVASFEANRLRCSYDPEGPFGRGLYIGIRR